MAENNSSQKICPFMSGPGSRCDPQEGVYTHHALCEGEKCAAWIPACDKFEQFKEQPGDCPAYEHVCQDERPCCGGYCALIFHQRGRS